MTSAPAPATLTIDSELPPTQMRELSLNSAAKAFRAHWPEYLMEGAELGLFMISACAFTALTRYPGSPVPNLIPSSFLRMALTGVAMGATLLLIVHTAWGKRSGAHMNPAMTLMFLRLRKVQTWDALFYMFFQFAGGISGVALSFLMLGRVLADPNVNFAATAPGMRGVLTAFVAEVLISMILALTVLTASNHKTLSRFTPYFAGFLVATYITLESPISGMSMNPARSLGSALPAHAFHSLWVYFLAPTIGMLLAAEIYLRVRSVQEVYCAKYHHNNDMRCIFRCRYAELRRN